MGYIAITKKGPIEVDKVSECIIILNSRKNYVFFELEISAEIESLSNNHSLSIYVPGKISALQSGKKITNTLFFLEWYYSQKNISRNKGNRLNINGKNTEIIFPDIESTYNSENNVTVITLSLEATLNDYDLVDSFHIYFTYETTQNISKTFGTLTVQSRYFDRKECPFGDFFENTVLKGDISTPKKMYCWFISKPTFYLDDYSNFENSQPRDIRIIEPTYLKMLANINWFYRFITKSKCKLFGYPQVINWKFGVSDISFEQSYKRHNKWDEIRLFATFKGFELSSIFIIVASLSSVFALLFYLIEKLWQS